MDPPAKDIPTTECLKDTVERFLPYWHETIVPAIKSGKRILIAAHGNSLRALVKYLDNMTDQEIVRHYYLGDQEAIKKAMDSVANQGKVK